MSAVIDDKGGRKVPLSSPSQSARDFAKLLNELEKDRSLLRLLSENCKERQKALSWVPIQRYRQYILLYL